MYIKSVNCSTYERNLVGTTVLVKQKSLEISAKHVCSLQHKSSTQTGYSGFVKQHKILIQFHM